MPHEVCPGRALLHSGTRYPAGSLVPPGVVTEALCSSGVLRETGAPPPERPQPEEVASPFAYPDFDASDPSSVTNVPLRVLPRLLKSIGDSDLLLEMHEADSRKGGRDLIEERLGELEAEDA